MRHIYPLADSSLSNDKDQFVMVFDTGKGEGEKSWSMMTLKKGEENVTIQNLILEENC